MAGVPGQTPEQKLAIARAAAGPFGTVREDQRAGITDYTPVPLRDPDQSVLNTVGRFADKYLGFGDDRRRSRILSGIASQWYGLDAGGNPSAGETPGIVYETQALGALPTTLARAGLDAYTGWLAKNVMGTSPEKALQDPIYNLVKQQLLSDPEWATKAAEKADAIHKAVREDMRLKAAHGLAQNFEESLGVMMGQLPVPGKLATKTLEGVEAAPSVMRNIEKGAEWFTPTVEPKVGNYLTGAAVGAGIGTLGDEEDTPVLQPDDDQSGLYDVRPAYEDGSVGYSGSRGDQEALAAAQEQELAKQSGQSRRTNFADGGKVGGVTDLVAKYLSEHGDGLYVGNNKKYMEHVRRHIRTVPQESEDLEMLEDYAEAPWGWSPSEEHALKQIINEHAVPLPPDLPLYRGVSGIHGGPGHEFNIDWEGGLGEEVNTSKLPVLPVTSNEGMAQDFATMLGNHPTNARLRLNRRAPVRGFPLLQSGQDEWVLTRPDMMVIRDAKPHNEDRDLLDVDVDYTQMRKYQDGGYVDKCDGGMAAVRSMRAKYAEGGKVNSVLRAIKDAIAHLDNGDTPSALRTLQASPAALQDPGIAAAVAKLRRPTTVPAGRQVLDAAVAADTNANKVATFAKGGLTTRARNALPGSTFAGPDRSYPIPDASHAANAKGRAKQQLNRGNLSSSQYSKIVARANKLLKD